MKNDFHGPAVALGLEPRELTIVSLALAGYVSFYTTVTAREEDPKEKDVLALKRDAGAALAARVVGHDRELRRGEFALLDRALRMLIHAYHEEIRIETPAADKATLRARADEVANVLLRVRKLQGLPW